MQRLEEPPTIYKIILVSFIIVNAKTMLHWISVTAVARGTLLLCLHTGCTLLESVWMVVVIRVPSF